MKKHHIVRHGKFLVGVLRSTDYCDGYEIRYFKSWNNAYHWLRFMVSFNGRAGGYIYFDDGAYRHIRVLGSYYGVTSWGDYYD